MDRLPLLISVFSHRPLVLLPVFLRRTHAGKHACKNEHPERRRRRTDFRSRFLYFRIAPWLSSRGIFCEEHMLAATPAKRQTPRQRRRLLSSCLRFPHRPAVPQTGRIFVGNVRQTARSGWRQPLPPRWSILGPLSLWQRPNHSAGSASVRRDFCIEKGQARKPVLF